MPKNIKGGNRAKKGKNSALREEKKLEKATEGQEYGICSKYYGNHRAEIMFYTNTNEDGSSVDKEVTAMGIIRGAIRKRTRLRAGDIVIVAPREYQDDKVDIVHVYKFDEVKKLKREVSLHHKILNNYDVLNNKADTEISNEDTNFDFENMEDSDTSTKPMKKQGEYQSYQSIYAGMPSIDDFDEEEEDELEDL
jgi:translation initiation factor 1A